MEFALVLPLLMMLLFGIIQYGYGLFQLQTFNSVLSEATESAATKVDSCLGLTSLLDSLADDSGLDPDSITGVKLRWLNDLGESSSRPDRLGRVQVTAVFAPFKIGVPLVPFPDTITRTRTATVQDITVPTLGTCG